MQNTNPNHIDHTILIDPRIGSKDLYPLLVELNVPVKLRELVSADIRWDGCGEDGKRAVVGIERKRLRDAVGSMRTGRFMGHQAKMLVEGCQDPVLLIEGAYRAGAGGELEVPCGYGKWVPLKLGGSIYTYRELDNWLNSVTILTPIRVIRSNSQAETVRIIADLWHWWKKPMSEHKSSQVFHRTGPAHVELVTPGIVRRVAKELNGVGWERAKEVEGKFKSVMEMLMAGEEDWEQLEGIGKTLAKRIVAELNGLDVRKGNRV